MIGLYRQSVAKIQMKKTKEYKEENFTGHEKYYQRENAGKKGKKKGIKASKSTSEIETKQSHRSTATRLCRSDQVIKVYGSEGNITSGNLRKTPGKFESLARLFSCVARESPSQTPRHRYQTYTALELESNPVQETSVPMDKVKNRATSICLQYLKANPRYKLIEQLDDIGSRVEKYWFIVYDTNVKTERLLTFFPYGPQCPLRSDAESRTLMSELLVAFQHPYVYPVLDVDLRHTANKNYAFITTPLSPKGSLKDMIYGSIWKDEWDKKYTEKSIGLPYRQVQKYGRQILEALSFLHRKGFPPAGHFHSGNIILQNGVARLSGLENAFMSFSSRMDRILCPRAASNPNIIDSVCFGHVLFEMSTGYELDTANPTPGHFLDVYQHPEVVEVLEYIFNNPDERIPNVEELLVFDLFRNIDLRELRIQAQTTPIFRAYIPDKGYDLLNEVKALQHMRVKAYLPRPPAVLNVESDTSSRSNGNNSASSRCVSVASLASVESIGSIGSVATVTSATSGIDTDTNNEDGEYDTDETDRDAVPIGEHRCLRLHAASMNRVNSFPSLNRIG